MFTLRTAPAGSWTYAPTVPVAPGPQSEEFSSTIPFVGLDTDHTDNAYTDGSETEVGFADSTEHIEAAGDYMCIRTADNSLILRETMKDLELRLDPRVFQRVPRTTIVNLDQVRQVKPHTNGECFLVLDSGAEVKVSRSYRDVVARFVH